MRKRPYRCCVCGKKMEVVIEADEVLIHPCSHCRQELRKEADSVKYQAIQVRIDQAVTQAVAKERADLAKHWEVILNTGAK